MRDIATKLKILVRFMTGNFLEWKKEVWNRDLDEPYCCNGYKCGCRASTVREVRDERNND